jgi:hypothetical protein
VDCHGERERQRQRLQPRHLRRRHGQELHG